MTYEFCLKQPESMLEITLRRKLDENPLVKHVLDRSSIQLSIRKYSYFPFPI